VFDKVITYSVSSLDLIMSVEERDCGDKWINWQWQSVGDFNQYSVCAQLKANLNTNVKDFDILLCFWITVYWYKL